MTTDRPLIINRITDRLRDNTGATSSAELLDILTTFGLATFRGAGDTELTRRTLTEARDLIDAIEEAIHTAQPVAVGVWRIEVDLIGAPAHDVTNVEDRPLVDDVVVWRHSGTLSEVLA